MKKNSKLKYQFVTYCKSTNKNITCESPCLKVYLYKLLISRKEQEELKVEMEKMSELIGELRENCQKLQTELLDSRNNLQAQQEQSTKQQNKPQSQQRDTSNVGVQVSLLTGNLMRNLSLDYQCLDLFKN